MNKKTILLIVVLLGIAGSIYYLEAGKASPPQAENAKGQEAINQVGGASTGADAQQIEQTQQREPQAASLETYPNPQRSSFEQWEASLTDEDKSRIAQKSSLFQKVPELTGISGYLNAEQDLKISDFRGKVVLIDFWTYTCINCIRTLPHLVEWDKKYKDKGLAIIGVHTPEFEFEKDYDNVRMAMEKYGIEYRVVQDNDYRTWREFKNRYWPRKYLIDGDGFIRYDHIGEGGYAETEETIKALLEEQGALVDDMPASQLKDETPTTRNTPELYAGYGFALPRGQNIGNQGGMQPDEEVDYTLPSTLRPDVIYLEGKWKSNIDNLEAMEDGAAIILKFSAKDANIVARSNTLQEMGVFIDGELISESQAGIDVENSEIKVDEARLYNAVSGEYGTYTIKLVAEKGFSFSAFTFG